MGVGAISQEFVPEAQKEYEHAVQNREEAQSRGHQDRHTGKDGGDDWSREMEDANGVDFNERTVREAKKAAADEDFISEVQQALEPQEAITSLADTERELSNEANPNWKADLASIHAQERVEDVVAGRANPEDYEPTPEEVAESREVSKERLFGLRRGQDIKNNPQTVTDNGKPFEAA